MAFLDPGASKLQAQSQASKRFELKLHGFTPERIEPNGDRYVVETLDIDDTMLLGQILVLVQDPNLDPTNPMNDPKVENRGVIPAVIITAGNGHLLGIPDPRVQVGEMAIRYPADVPMFYRPGDVVLVDRNAKGRSVMLGGREIRIVNQIDVLSRLQGIRLVRKDNEWVQEDNA